MYDPQLAQTPTYQPDPRSLVAASGLPENAAPAPQMRPPRVGLIASASLPTDPARWQGGIRYQPEGCSQGGGVITRCAPGTGGTTAKTTSAGASIVDWEPYPIWDYYRCSTFGTDLAEAEARARRRLEACESRHLERELWRGDAARADQLAAGTQRFLASLASDVVTSTAATPANALACLEEAIGGCGCGQRGMIHATRQIVTLWAAQQLVRREGGLILTINDTIIVSGAGYDGSGPPGIVGGAPTAPATNAIWAYATGMVEVRRDPIRMVGKPDEWINRETNLIEARAERIALASWDGCCHFAAQIEATLCGIGGS